MFLVINGINIELELGWIFLDELKKRIKGSV